MRRWVTAIGFLMVVMSGCGGTETGFRIDNVTITPDDLPLNSQADEDVRISALVYDDNHDVLEVLVRSDEAILWIDMIPGRYPKWSASVPVGDFAGYPIGDYWMDIEARDDANRRVKLENAVKLSIRED